MGEGASAWLRLGIAGKDMPTSYGRPRQSIRVVPLGPHWRGDGLLVAEVPNDEGSLEGLRHLEGGVAFGESLGTALRRAFREETGLDVDIVGAPLVMENLFEHNGVCGHEVIFAAEERLPDGAFARQTRIDFRENDGNRLRGALGAACRP